MIFKSHHILFAILFSFSGCLSSSVKSEKVVALPAKEIIKECTVKGTIYDEMTKEIIPGAKVYLVGSDGSQADTNSDADGFYSFNFLKDSVNYEISAVSDEVYTKGDRWKKGRKKYLSSSTSILSCDIKQSATIEQNIGLPLVREGCGPPPNIEFEFQKWDLKPESKFILKTFYLEILKPNPTLSIEMGAHSDSREDLTLSQKRAEAAVQYLIELGIDPNRLKAKGYGKGKPKEINEGNARYLPKEYKNIFPAGTILNKKFISSLSKEEQEVAHQMNRRIEFHFLCFDWSPGKSADFCSETK